MSNYTKTTDFAAKDSLPTGDAGKIIRGAEFGTEFDNIATAIATKADTAGPTLTGTTTFDTLSDGTIAVTAFVDEDDMSSDSATMLPTQQSVKAYVDSQTTAQDLDFEADTGGPLSIDLDSETLTLTGGTGVDTSGAGNAVTFAIDSTVATLTGTQTLTNKTLTSADIDTPDIDGGTIDGTVIGGATPAAVSATTVSATGNITVDGTVDGRDVATDGTKLDTVETNADVTDTTNVTAAGALMDSEVTNLDQVKAFDSADYATAAQGTTADNALPKTGGAMTGAITTNSTFDGRDVATDGTKLDGIEALADVTDTTNVTAAGALMDSELTDLTAVKSLDQGVATTDSPTFAGLTTTADMTFGDNDKAIFGAGSDLQLYHDGSNSYVQDAGDGALILNTTNGGGVYVYSAGETMATFNSNGAVNLYYDNAAKLATTATGIDVTGTVTADGLTASGSGAVGSFDRTDANAIIELKRSGSLQGYIGASTGGDIILYNASAAQKLRAADNGDISFYEDTGTTAKFFWDSSAERLGVGTTTPNAPVDAQLSGGGGLPVSSGTAQTYGSLRVGATSFNTILDMGSAGASGAWLQASDKTGLGTNYSLLLNPNGGNVGIGTNSPSQLLHLTSSGFAYARLNNSSFTGIDIGQHTGGNVYFNLRDNKDQIFQTNNTEAMRIDSSGNLLVGTTNVNPAANNVTGHALKAGGLVEHANSGAMVMRLNRTDSSGSIIEFRQGTSAVGQINARSGDLVIGTGTTGLQFYDVGNAIFPLSASGNTNRDAAIDLGEGSNRFKDLYLSGGLRGDTTFKNNAGTTEYARFDSSGNLIVGTTSTADSARFSVFSTGTAASFRTSPTTAVSLVTFRNGNGLIGKISTSGSTTTYNTSSDQRLKENITDAPSASDDIDAIQVRSFDWKADGSHQKYGMVAQELNTVAPEAVSAPEDPEEMMGVDYSKLVPMLVKEIQSLRARVAQLETN
ncbi:tail fiber domain-containing protein [Gammaproteobacteria bacterium]|nr:tail fiber domain-containing protein [Gammaproteobacteria bacterium]